MNRMTIKKIALIILLAALGGGIATYISRKSTPQVQLQQGNFYEYDEARDKADILGVFETDSHWLLPSNDPYYDPEFKLQFRAPNRDPLYIGTLQVKVLRENNQFIGFTMYYKKTVTEGVILFIAVKKEFRGKGYGKVITTFALDQLKAMGLKVATLCTRTVNEKARTLYTKLGFHETHQEPDGYIYFAKELN